jgi:hypothetical protein
VKKFRGRDLVQLAGVCLSEIRFGGTEVDSGSDRLRALGARAVRMVVDKFLFELRPVELVAVGELLIGAGRVTADNVVRATKVLDEVFLMCQKLVFLRWVSFVQ